MPDKASENPFWEVGVNLVVSLIEQEFEVSSGTVHSLLVHIIPPVFDCLGVCASLGHQSVCQVIDGLDTLLVYSNAL